MAETVIVSTITSTLRLASKMEMYLIINAIFDVVKTGCRWRMLPHDMPPWQTVYYHIRKWQADNT